MKCFRCGGTGRITFSQDVSWRLMEGPCPTCGGLGEVRFSKSLGCIIGVLAAAALAIACLFLIRYFSAW